MYIMFEYNYLFVFCLQPMLPMMVSIPCWNLPWSISEKENLNLFCLILQMTPMNQEKKRKKLKRKSLEPVMPIGHGKIGLIWSNGLTEWLTGKIRNQNIANWIIRFICQKLPRFWQFLYVHTLLPKKLGSFQIYLEH